uniref:Uncharacterized protein n=1 Tax=candidate division WOR-3 bacterium TaxID=2052148 RepID=A0A7C4TAR8_UNCW3
MELLVLLFVSQIDSNKFSYETQIPFDAEAQVYEIDSALGHKIEFFKDYKGLKKALLFLQPDSSHIIEIYSEKNGGIVKERVRIEPEIIDQIQQEIALIKIREPLKTGYDRSGYRDFLGSSFVFAYAVQAPLMVMALSPDDYHTGVAIYMLSSASGFVIPLILTRNCDISKAHAQIFLLGGIHGGYIAGALSGIAGVDVFEGPGALFTVTGSITGEYLGFQSADKFDLSLGRGNTIFAIGDFTGATSTGLLSLFDNWSNPSFNYKHYLATSIAGLGIGLYAGTKLTENLNLGDGDPSIFANCGIVGGAILPALLSWFDNKEGIISGKMYISAGISGLGLGSILGYRIIKEKDFTESEGNIIVLGGIAGALTGLGMVYLAKIKDSRAYYTGMLIGDIAGALATASFIKVGESNKHSQIHLHPESIFGLCLYSINRTPFRTQLITLRI